jgi:hypothetical protein
MSYDADDSNSDEASSPNDTDMRLFDIVKRTSPKNELQVVSEIKAVFRATKVRTRYEYENQIYLVNGI